MPCSPAPQTDGVKATKGNLRWAKHLTMHREIYTKHCSNTKQLFSVSNGLLGESKTTPIPSEIPSSALPDRFYMFFSKINPEHTARLWCSPFWTSSILYDGPKLCLSKPVTEEKIRKLIVELPTKTCMLDHILSLKNSFLIYCLLLKNCNLSLCSGAIPCQFKQTIITPLLKKPGLNPNDLKNFRPVSNLPFISKILEKKVLTQLQKHLSENNLLEISPHTERTTAQRQLYLVLLMVFSKMPMTDWSQCWLC